MVGPDRGRRHEEARHVGEHGIPRVDDAHAALARAAPQRGRRVGAVDAQRDRVDVEPLDQRVVDRLGPADDRDDLLLVEQRQRRAEPVGGAVGLEQPRRVVRAHRGVGRGEDARAHPPQRSVRAVVREHAPARDHEARGLGREAGERVGGLDREPVLVDVAAGDRAQALGRGHLTPHAIGFAASVRARAQPMTVARRPDTSSSARTAANRSSSRAQRAACAARRADVADDAQPPVGERGLRVRARRGRARPPWRSRSRGARRRAARRRADAVDRAAGRVERDAVPHLAASGHAADDRLDHDRRDRRRTPDPTRRAARVASAAIHSSDRNSATGAQARPERRRMPTGSEPAA